MIDKAIEDTRSALDEETFTSAWEEGKAMDLDQALAYALEVMEEFPIQNKYRSKRKEFGLNL